jgi:hypothetical protein
MSGYEKSPDCGGPEPHWHDVVVAVLVMLSVTALLTFEGLLGMFKRLLAH